MNGKLVLNQLTPYKQGMQIEEVKKKYGLNRIVKLASNENPFGYSPKLEKQLSSVMHDFALYPDGHTAELRKVLAAKLRVGEDQLVFGSGSDEIVQLICRAFLYQGVNTVMATPTFPQYKHNAVIEGAEIKEIPVVNGYHDLEAMSVSLDANTKVVWLCSPNNPTGCLIQKDDFYSFMEKCPKDILVVLDEAYYEYVEPGLDPDAITNINNYPNLLVLRTFSKAYGLAGLRIGYGVGHQDVIARLNVVRGPFNTTSYTQQAALIALEDDAFIDETFEKNKLIREKFQQFIDEIGWSYYDSQTNFLLISLPVTGEDMFQYLLKHGFIVRPGEGLGCPNTIRLTIGNREDMEELQDIIKEFTRRR